MRIDQGFPVFYGKDGTLLKNGFAYVGTLNQDAETHLVSVYWDAALTLPAPNPLTIKNGIVVRRGLPAAIYTALEFSITVRDSNGVLQFSSLNAAAFTANDIVASLTPALDALFVKKSGDTMTGPLVIPNAVGANDLYSRSQLDALLSYRPSATYVVNSVQKWIDLGNNAPGNDYTDVLIKRGTWNVSPITLPAACKRLRGELGAELYFAPSIIYNYGINIADAQTTEVTQLLLTMEISQSADTHNTQKTAIIGRDADIHDVEIAFVIQGGASALGTCVFTGVSSANGLNVTVNAYNKDASVISSTSCTIVGLSIIAPSSGFSSSVRNVVISQFSATIQSKNRYGSFACSTTAAQVFVLNPTTNDTIISWKSPKNNRVGLSAISTTTLNLIMFTGAITTAYGTQIVLEGTLNVGGSTVNMTAFNFTNTSTHRVSIQYKFVLFFSALNATYTCNNTYTNLFGVFGAIFIYCSGTLSITNVVAFASVVEVAINVSTPVTTTTNGIKTCRQVKNCVVTINAGTQYAADTYYSSDTSALAANTAVGGWNN